MATVAEGLFGVTPESLQQERQNALLNRGIQLAQLDPFQQAYANIYAGAGNVGRGVGGLLGAEDPELMRVRQRQQLLQGINPADPASLRSGIEQAMASKDFTLAQELASRALTAEKTQSEITKNLRERAAADPLQQLLRTGKFTPTSVEKYAQSGKISDLETASEDPTALSETKEGIFLVNKRTGDKISRIGDAPDRGTKVNVAPEIKLAPNIVDAVSAFEKSAEKEVNMIESATLAKQLINQTANSNNSQTWEAARTTIAKAVGENKLSNEDIRRTGVDPRLVQGALDWVNKKVTGVPNQDIQKQLYVLGSVLENNAKARYDSKVMRAREAAKAAKFEGNVQTYFPLAGERERQIKPDVVDWASMGQNK